MVGDYDNDSKAAFFQATYDLTDRLAATFGGRYTEDTKRFSPEGVVYGDASMAPGSIYESTWSLLAGVFLGSSGPILAGDKFLPSKEFQEEFDDTSFMANITYSWTEELMTYINYSQGFKSGGFDLRFVALPIGPDTGLPANEPSTFDPETVDSYEIEIK